MQQPDAMRDALARHDVILREAVAKRAGHVVKGTGDGVHAVFATADDALHAAVDAQLAFRAEDWLVSEPLRVLTTVTPLMTVPEVTVTTCAVHPPMRMTTITPRRWRWTAAATWW